jgi:vacuolar iron transporter family protein
LSAAFEKEELARIYAARGVELSLARKVAQQLMAKPRLRPFLLEQRRPSFSLLSPSVWLISAVSMGSLVFLALLGMIGAKTGGAAIVPPTIRVMFWGALAMALTAGIGVLVGRVI